MAPVQARDDLIRERLPELYKRLRLHGGPLVKVVSPDGVVLAVQIGTDSMLRYLLSASGLVYVTQRPTWRDRSRTSTSGHKPTEQHDHVMRALRDHGLGEGLDE